jgi:elongation factor P
VIENVPYKVVKIKQGGRGRGASFVKANLKNLETSAVIERTFTNDEMVEFADLERETVEYSWRDTSTNCFVFMNMDSFEEHRVDVNELDNAEFMREGLQVKLIKFRDKIIGAELPEIVECTVVEIDDSGTGMHAILDTGARLSVPDFIKVDTRIRINTYDKSYVERVN